MNTDPKLLNKILTNQIHQYFKGEHIMINWNLSQEFQVNSTFTNQCNSPYQQPKKAACFTF